MIVSHRSSDPALRPAGGSRLVRVSLAAALGLALFGGAAYGGSRLLASDDKAGNPAAAGELPPPAAAPGGEEVPGAFPADSGSASSTPPAASSTAPTSKAATSPTKKPTQTGGGTNGNTEATGPTAEVLRLVNSERSKAGCGALTNDSRLASAAQKHSADMASNSYFSHTSQNGDEMADRIDASGYKWRSIGENIAKGQSTPAAVMQAWMNSSGHRANILNCGFRNIGIGLAYDGRSPVWTQDFGTPR
ncbi:CAP domain-containing protein [Virgisporangium aurantiacum]|uniref:SCP domain-containing protein n=1 Tax=Virgisporangium aurantiacum TaxID=175570 RepID=A0A8J3ZD31_9ACTN|nr:CAP domain-containing protein [Virgisporangium aurantiacum]GIJ60573.1 hypothetical protein Vau01_080890 [Virgisporangium aurantiacum]